MALRATEIQQVLAEIRPAIRGGWIQKISQPGPRALVLDIRVPGHTHRLLVSCRPETARIHFVSRRMSNPPTPPVFCQFLRAHVQGARIDDVRQVSQDRIIELRLVTQAGPRTLISELTGRTADVILLNADGLVQAKMSGDRTLIGRPYALPAHRGPGPQGQDADHVIEHEASGAFPLSAAIESRYLDLERRLAVENQKDARRRALQKTLKKEQRRIEAWREDLEKAGTYREHARYGELIKANLGAIQRGVDRVTVVDYYDSAMPQVTIPLDPTKSPQGNMDSYFKKHQKYLSAERELHPRILRAERELNSLRQELRAIEQNSWTPPAPSPSPAHASPRRTGRTGDNSGRERCGPFRRFTSTDGLPIFIGRNARENEELTFGLAKSDDLWLHARGAPGSHVLVRLQKGQDPPPATVQDAATLALLYSDLRKSGKGEVIYTRRKWVKKVKGGAPGAVIVTQDHSLHITLDKKRLEALKIRSSVATP